MVRLFLSYRALLYKAMTAAFEGATRRKALLQSCATKTPAPGDVRLKRSLQRETLSSASTSASGNKVTPDAKRILMSESSPPVPRDLFPEPTSVTWLIYLYIYIYIRDMCYIARSS